MAVSKVKIVPMMELESEPSRIKYPQDTAKHLYRCYVPNTPMPARYYPVPVEDRALEPRQAVYSKDGTCGPANGNTICDPNSTVYKGSCCSVGHR